ncbi:MAG: hypothetical protein COA94_08320 [Rickettsiales bacterium]|nr:MAG: hypothetical protein COA94_08320 [Rickettsiales bacterium]
MSSKETKKNAKPESKVRGRINVNRRKRINVNRKRRSNKTSDRQGKISGGRSTKVNVNLTKVREERKKNREYKNKGYRGRTKPEAIESELISDVTNDGILVTREAMYRATSKAKASSSKLPMYVVRGVTIRVADQETLIRESVATISNSSARGKNSINDPRTGVTMSDVLCPTCNQGITCQGHPGLIKLSRPLLHPMYIREIIRILRIICNVCGEPLMGFEEMKNEGITSLLSDVRLKVLEVKCIKRTCQSHAKFGIPEPCRVNPQYDVKKSDTARAIKMNAGRSTLSAGKVSEILGRLTNKNAILLGFAYGMHPKNYVLKVLPVMVPRIRPSSVHSGTTMEDAQTQTYKKIINANNAILNNLNSADADNKYAELVGYVNDFLWKNNSQSNNPHTQAANIPKKLGNKEGILRRNMQGKRVDNSARTVIVGVSGIPFWVVMLPRVIAETLYAVETVGPGNITWLTFLLRNNKITYIIPYGGPRKGISIKIDINSGAPNIGYTLKFGDRIRRNILDGDHIIVNRNPTLHKGGLLAYEVKIWDNLTLGMTLPATTLHNADFDGDEVNIHMPTTPAAVAELEIIVTIKAQIGVGVIFDALTSVNLLTFGNAFNDRSNDIDKSKEINVRIGKCNFDQLVNKIYVIGSLGDNITPSFNESFSFRDYRVRVGELDKPSNGFSFKTYIEKLKIIDEFGIGKYTGKSLFSLLLPNDFNYERKDGDVIIRNGVLLSGVIGKDDIGPMGSLVVKLRNSYGLKVRNNFVASATNVFESWISMRGFSVGYDDCHPFNEKERLILENTVSEEVIKAEAHVMSLGPVKKDPMEEEERENEVISTLNIVKTIGQKITKEILTRIPKSEENEDDFVVIISNKFMEHDTIGYGKMVIEGDVLTVEYDNTIIASNDWFYVDEILNRSLYVVADKTIIEIREHDEYICGIMKENSLVIMSDSKAKGNPVNVAQITSLLGQQYFEGKRPGSTVYFGKDSSNIRARGFCTRSYTQGSTPYGFFAVAKAGREGLVETATGTQDTGTSQRSAVKALEDITIRNDGTVRASNGKIIQFHYGDNSVDTERIIFKKVGNKNVRTFIDISSEVNKLNTGYGIMKPIK